jgi:FkbM family methyltransferase
VPRPIVFDIGANVGQSIARFNELLPDSRIWSFEPSPATFRTLAANVGKLPDVTLENLGVGSETGTRELFENDHPDMSSFLAPSETAWGKIVGRTSVPTTRLDDYCDAHGIGHIDVLKTDTQGYELEVLKGAERLIAANRIRLVAMEVIFSNMYEELPAFDVVYRHLVDRGFRLVAFYRFDIKDCVANWADCLFANPAFTPE